MKKVVRILIPLFLILVILLCTFWYLFVYDRDFTRDVLINIARSSEERGKHSVATWFYDLAYKQSNDDESVAIELAEQYKKNGNYTKAENALANAITNGGNIDLYVALCQTYIEQDKLMDAVNMLNNITNPEIKAQIDALRPAMPEPGADQQSGIYKQYISVALQSDGSDIYYSTTVEYPSVKTGVYTEPIPMVDGENTLYAVAIRDGLISPLAIYTYTITGVVEEVEIADPAMEAAIRETLKIAEDALILSSDLWKIETFTIPEDAQNYEPLQYMTGLTSLTVQKGHGDQLANISYCNALRELHIRDTAVSSDVLDTIGSITTLEKLTLSGCGLTSVNALDTAINIVELDISNNTIRSIEAVQNMPSLKVLNCKKNVIVDLTPLTKNSNLTQLDISYNAITTIAPLSKLTGLTLLEANNNAITDIGSIDTLTSLSYLNLSYNAISDVKKIASCSALTDLSISSNEISDISALGALENLMYFDFSYNKVTQLPTWSKDSDLVSINGSHNLITTIDSLSGMEYLNNVNMDYNAEITSVDALADCPVLIRVDVYGTKVTGAEALTKQSIIVIYNEVDGELD